MTRSSNGAQHSHLYLSPLQLTSPTPCSKQNHSPTTCVYQIYVSSEETFSILDMPDELAPPRKSVELEDPGAKELGTSSFPLGRSNSNAVQPSRATNTSPMPRKASLDDLR